MKVVSRQEFIKLPAGTVYTDYAPHIFGELCIKGDSLDNDWWEQRIVGELGINCEEIPEVIERLDAGEDIPVDLDIEARDAMFDVDQLYAVWSKEDVTKLISRLQETLQMPGGRPSTYTLELADLFCSRISEGNSMRKVCKAEDMPDTTTIFKWIREKEDFSLQYARAKDESGDADQDKLDEIAEKVLIGEYDPQSARVAADIIKWSASKKKPKKYGDKQQIEHSGSIELDKLSDEELDIRIQALQNAE